MGYGRFIWRNAWRNKRRTALTVLSIGFSLFLLMTLLTFMKVLMNPVTQDEAALRLITSRRTSIAEVMPFAYGEKIRRLFHVEHVAALQWFNGIYKDPDFQFANFSTDPAEIFEIYTEQKISPEARAAFVAERDAATVSENLAKRFNWKIGDRITLQGTIFPVDPELKIVGIFSEPLGQEILYFRYDYLDELLGNFGQVGAFVLKASDVTSTTTLAQEIDAMFQNSPAETKTETEKAFVLGFVSMLGNIQLIIGSVAGVVVFTMLLVSVSSMTMTIRERLREVAILKTLGFSQQTIMGLVLSEALLISLSGTGLGCLLAESLRLVDLNRTTQGFITQFNPEWMTYGIVLATGTGIGLISGFFPARQALNLTITDAMRRLD